MGKAVYFIQPQDSLNVNDSVPTIDSLQPINIPIDPIAPSITISDVKPAVLSPNDDSVFIRLEQREKAVKISQKAEKPVIPKETKTPQDTTNYEAMANRQFPFATYGLTKQLNIPECYDQDLKPAPVFTESQTITSHNNFLGNKPVFIYKDAFLFLFLVIVIVIIWIKINYEKYLNDVIDTVYKPQLALRILRDKNIIHKRVFAWLNIIYVVVLSLFIYQTSIVFQLKLVHQQGLGDYAMIMLIVAFVTVGKILINHFVGVVFKVRPQVLEFLHNNSLLNKSLGLALIPLTFMIFYMGQAFQAYMVIMAMLVIGLFYFIRVFRGIQIILRKDILIFYSLLYLCSLEILPVLVGFKLIKELV